MSAILATLKAAYEVNNMTPEEIAEDQELDLAAVKAGLMQVSPMYRKACGKEEEIDDGLNFTDQQLREVNKVMFELATSAEDEHLRFKAASYIRDDKKGRKEVIKAVQGTTFNILQFNQQIQAARAQISDMKKKLIELPA